MARLPRLSLGGWPHLLMQRGHNQQRVFADAQDQALFLQILREVAPALGVAVHAYALWPCELGLLVTPSDGVGLGKMMQALGRRYGLAFNQRHGRSGSLWNGRFCTALIEPELHVLPAMRWLETEQDPPHGSSRAHHLGLEHDALITEPTYFWSLGNTPFEREAHYKTLLAQPLSAAHVQQLKEAVLKGWPCGSPAWLTRIGALTERRLMPLSAGRPRKRTQPP